MRRELTSGLEVALITLFFSLPCFCLAYETGGAEPGSEKQVATEKAAGDQSATHANRFGTALVLVSLGSAGMAAYFHMSHGERKQMASQIKELDRFVATTSCIVDSAQADDDDEPIIEEINKGENAMQSELEAIRGQQSAFLDRYSEVEARLTRILGRD